MGQVSQLIASPRMRWHFLRSRMRGALFTEVPSHVWFFQNSVFRGCLLLPNLQQWLTARALACGRASFAFPLYHCIYSLWLRFISFTTQWISHCHTANNSVWFHPGFSRSPRWESLCCAPFLFFTCHVFSVCYDLHKPAGSLDIIMLNYFFVWFTSLARVYDFPKIRLCQVPLIQNLHSA